MLVVRSFLVSLVVVLCLSAPNVSVPWLPDGAPSQSPLWRRGIHDYAKEQDDPHKGLNVKDYVAQGLQQAEEAKQKRLSTKLGKAAKDCWGALCGRRNAKHVDAGASHGPQPQREHQRKEQDAPGNTANEASHPSSQHGPEKPRRTGSSSSEPNSRTHLLTSGTGSRRTGGESVDWSGQSHRKKQQQGDEPPKREHPFFSSLRDASPSNRKTSSPLERQRGFRQRPRDFRAKYAGNHVEKETQTKAPSSQKFSVKSILSQYTPHRKADQAGRPTSSTPISTKEADPVHDPFLSHSHPNIKDRSNRQGARDTEHEVPQNKHGLGKIDEDPGEGRSSKLISLGRSRHARQESHLQSSSKSLSGTSFSFPFLSDTSKQTSKQTSRQSSRQSSGGHKAPKWAEGSQHIWGIFGSSKGPSGSSGASQRSATLGLARSDSQKTSSGKSSFSFQPGSRQASGEREPAARVEPQAKTHDEAPSPHARVGWTNMAGSLKSSSQKAVEPRRWFFLRGPAAQPSGTPPRTAAELERQRSANRKDLLEAAETVQDRPSTVGSSSSQWQVSKSSSDNLRMHSPVQLSMGTGVVPGSKGSHEALALSSQASLQTPPKEERNPYAIRPEQTPKAVVGKPDWKLPAAPSPYALKTDQKPRAIIDRQAGFPQRQPSLPPSSFASTYSQIFSSSLE